LAFKRNGRGIQSALLNLFQQIRTDWFMNLKKFLFERSTWTDVIGKYQSYVNSQADWGDVITCYGEYTSQ